MTLTTADAKRWLRGFDAAARVDREEKRVNGPRPEWSISLSLSLIEAARADARKRPQVDARRQEEDDRVRDVWRRLRLGPVTP